MTDRKALMNRFYKEIFDNRNLDAVDEFAADDFVDHEEPPPGVEVQPGREGAKQMLSVFLAAFNPLSLQVHDQYVDGDTVITRGSLVGTHVGEFAGIPATNKQITTNLIDIIEFRGDKAIAHWGQTDAMGMLDQMGALPPMG